MNKIRCKLNELVEVKNGSTPSTERVDFYDGNIVWITPKDLSNSKSKYIYSSERKITNLLELYLIIKYFLLVALK